MTKRAGSSTGSYVVMDGDFPVASYDEYRLARMRCYWQMDGEELRVEWMPREEARKRTFFAHAVRACLAARRAPKNEEGDEARHEYLEAACGYAEAIDSAPLLVFGDIIAEADRLDVAA